MEFPTGNVQIGSCDFRFHLSRRGNLYPRPYIMLFISLLLKVLVLTLEKHSSTPSTLTSRIAHSTTACLTTTIAYHTSIFQSPHPERRPPPRWLESKAPTLSRQSLKLPRFKSATKSATRPHLHGQPSSKAHSPPIRPTSSTSQPRYWT